MPDDHTPAGAPHGPTIDVDDTAALDGWARKFDATAQQIRDAVEAVGSAAADVELHLKGSHATTNADQEARAERSDGASS